MGLNHCPLDWQSGALPHDHRSPQYDQVHMFLLLVLTQVRERRDLLCPECDSEECDASRLTGPVCEGWTTGGGQRLLLWEVWAEGQWIHCGCVRVCPALEVHVTENTSLTSKLLHSHQSYFTHIKVLWTFIIMNTNLYSLWPMLYSLWPILYSLWSILYSLRPVLTCIILTLTCVDLYYTRSDQC